MSAYTYDGVNAITKEWVVYHRSDFMQLVEVYRKCIELPVVDPYDLIRPKLGNIPELLKIFDPLITPQAIDVVIHQEINEIQKHNEWRDSINELSSDCQKGVAIAFESYQYLGYSNPFDAIQNVVNNFKHKWNIIENRG